MSSPTHSTESEGFEVGPDFRQADVDTLLDYVLTNHHIGGSADEVPLDRSLLEAGIIDSFDLIELIEFIESNWQIQIPDEEITRENMGSIHRMASFIRRKQVS